MKPYIMILLALSVACGGTDPRIKYYDLSRAEQPEAHYAPTGPIVALEAMHAAPGLGDDQVAIRSVAGNIEHYLYHRWHAPLPLLVNELVAEVFVSSGKFRRVDVAHARDDADLIVTGRILRLEGIRRQDDRSIVRVSIAFSAQSPATGAIVMTEIYSRDLPVTEHSVDSLATALRDAISSISREAAKAVATRAALVREETGGKSARYRENSTDMSPSIHFPRAWCEPKFGASNATPNRNLDVYAKGCQRG